MSDSLGGTTQYAYDVEDRLAGLTAPWGTVYGFGYDGEGRRTSLTSSSGRASSYAYENGLLSALTHVQSGVTLTNLAYEYGPDGQLAAILDRVDPSKSKTISYDNLNRLVQVAEGVPGEAPLPIEDYAYDEEGNRTASHLSAIYSSNDHNQLLEDADHTYTYDPKGNRTTKTRKSDGKTETYTYDSQNRLVGYASPTTTASYAYDPFDRRIAKTVDGVETAFVYDTDDLSSSTSHSIVLEFKGANLTRRWTHSQRVDEPLGFEAYDADNTPGAGNAYELYADRMGSITSVVDTSSGSVAAEYSYDSFGQRTQHAGSLFQFYGYTGREDDPESGLYHYRARAYDPAAGTFLQSDPVGFRAGSFGLYEYVSNDPLNFADPSGLTKGSIRKPGAAGPATTEFNLLGTAAREMREQAIEAIASSALNLIMKTMTQARSTLARGKMSPIRSEVHHCFPQSVGGSNDKSNLRKMRRIRHMYLHKLMRTYMKPFRTKRAKNTFVGIDVSSTIFSKKELEVIFDQFYRDIDAVLGLGC